VEPAALRRVDRNGRLGAAREAPERQACATATQVPKRGVNSGLAPAK
jgi:hypothetical protein